MKSQACILLLASLLIAPGAPLPVHAQSAASKQPKKQPPVPHLSPATPVTTLTEPPIIIARPRQPLPGTQLKPQDLPVIPPPPDEPETTEAAPSAAPQAKPEAKSAPTTTPTPNTPATAPAAAPETMPSATPAPKQLYAYISDNIGHRILEYRVGDDGHLSPLPNGIAEAGYTPAKLAATPNGDFLYASDFQEATIKEYSIAPEGWLTPLKAPRVRTGHRPEQMAVGAGGTGVYVVCRGEVAENV